MSGSTTELNLKTAVDSDDTADYLTLSLADSLRTLDALFNNLSGHTHSGAHQGGPVTQVPVTAIPDGSITAIKIADGSVTTAELADASVTSAKLKPPIDIADWFRSTATPTPKSNTGAGLEMFYDPSVQRGVLQTYSRTAAAWQDTYVQGLNVRLIGGASSQFYWALDGTNGTVSSAARIQSGTDMVVGNGTLYVGSQGDTTIVRQAADALRIPSTLYFGGDNTVRLYRSGQIGGQPHPLIIDNSGNGLWILQEGLTFYTPTDPAGGGQTIRVIGPSSRPASQVGGGEVHIAIRLFVDGDITAGTYVHGISFIQTSDPRAKQSMLVLNDTDCMTRVRDDDLHVYTYQIPPPIVGGYPRPTPNEIGFDATDVYHCAPEFAATDASGTPTAVNYANMAALLWGALRGLDKRVQALEA